MSNTNNPPSSERLIEELDRGRELAAELCRLIQKSNEADHSTFVESVIGSYEKTLSMLKMYASHSSNDTISEDPSQKRKRSLPITKDLSDEQSLAKRVDNEMQNLGHEKLFRGKQKICDITCSSPTESSEKTTIVHHLDDYFLFDQCRRVLAGEIVSATPVYDGYQWRKYGQKEILNAKYPRSYYRCIHKYEQKVQTEAPIEHFHIRTSILAPHEFIMYYIV